MPIFLATLFATGSSIVRLRAALGFEVSVLAK